MHASVKIYFQDGRLIFSWVAPSIQLGIKSSHAFIEPLVEGGTALAALELIPKVFAVSRFCNQRDGFDRRKPWPKN